MNVALSEELESIIARQVVSGQFSSPEAAVEASVRFFDQAGKAAIEQSRASLRSELRTALEESRNGDSRAMTCGEFLVEARGMRKRRNAEK